MARASFGVVNVEECGLTVADFLMTQQAVRSQASEALAKTVYQ